MRFFAALVLLAAQAAGWGNFSTHLDQQLAPAGQPLVHITPSATTVLPVQIGNAPLILGATSAYAVDLATMTPLYEKNADVKLPIASLTKLMTVLVVLHNHTASQIVKVSHLPTYSSADELMGLQAGQQFSVGSLLAAALIPSDDDAADALAVYDADTIPRFVAKMNLLATQLSLPGVHFDSADGLSDSGYATARALAIIAKIDLQSPTFVSLITQTTKTIKDLAGQSYTLTTTDQLLQNDDFSGIKTGYTIAAGECFVGLTSINGHQIITVVLGATDRFGDSQALRDWVAGNWQWQKVQ